MRNAAPVYALVRPGRLEAFAESEAELADGQIIPRQGVIRELDECIARLEGRKADTSRRRTAAER